MKSSYKWTLVASHSAATYMEKFYTRENEAVIWVATCYLAIWLGTIKQLSWQQDRRNWGQGTVCWIGVKVAVLCARQYISWNIFVIKVLNDFWYFNHPILTMISTEAYLKHNWRNCLWKKLKSTISEENFFYKVTNMLLSKS